MSSPDHYKEQAVAALLKPCLRFCMRNLISLQEVIRIAKATLVDLAIEELESKNEPVNTSRIALLTGVHRKDVQYIRDQGGPKQRPSLFAQRLLARWENDARYRTANGKCRVLRCDGERSEFWALVQSVSREINPASALSDLESRGAVVRRGDTVRLVYEFERLGSNPIEGYRLGALDAQDLLEAVQDNIQAPSVDPNLHLRTEFDNIFASDIPKIRRWLLLEGSKFHRRVRAYLSRFDRDLRPERVDPAGVKIVVGAYSRAPTSKQVDLTSSD